MHTPTEENNPELLKLPRLNLTLEDMQKFVIMNKGWKILEKIANVPPFVGEKVVILMMPDDDGHLFELLVSSQTGHCYFSDFNPGKYKLELDPVQYLEKFISSQKREK